MYVKSSNMIKMNIIKILLLGAIIVLGSCNKEKKQEEVAVSEPTSKEHNTSISELSIYNLPAIWTTQDNKKIELKELKGDVLVMVMIYTSCKAACPRLVADMRDIETQIPESKKENVKLLLVSIDPETDTPERLKKFSIENEMESDQWLFLRGTKSDTREFAAVLAVNYKKISPMDFSHSNIISVFDQGGELVHQQEGLGVNNKETVDKIIELAH